jgi:hypothetical protein
VNKEDKEEWSEMHCGDAAGSASWVHNQTWAHNSFLSALVILTVSMQIFSFLKALQVPPLTGSLL